MKIASALTDDISPSRAKVLTIGNFDGVHLGHQLILNETIQQAAKIGTASACITFSNHPSTILRPEHPVLALCTHEHKMRLLEACSLDLLYSIPFTKELSGLTAEQFLKKVRECLLFEYLILGQDATLGNERQGSRSVIQELSRQLHFKAIYLADYLLDGERVSSRLIRKEIQNGELLSASKCLGRPYSIYSRVRKGAGRGEALGIHTANLSVEGLCIPPLGVYAVQLIHGVAVYPAVANLGCAPTFEEKSTPLLEVHVWDRKLELYGEFVEVVFRHFIRQEKRFAGSEDLKKQIADDVIKAKILST